MMRYSLSLLAALLILGCGGDSPQKSTTQVETKESAKTMVHESVTSDAPTKTIAPARIEHVESSEKGTDIKKVVEKKVETAKSARATVVDGAVVFKRCTSCHGQKAEKAALGKSQIIAGWEVEKIKDALHGYQNGNYGGAMKALMQAQAKTLDDQEIDALAEYISSL